MTGISDSAWKTDKSLSGDRERLLNLLREQSGRKKITVHPYARASGAVCARLPTSWAQQRLWFLEQLEGGSAGYHASFSVGLQGRLNQKALQKALDTLVQRHEILRTVFVSVEGEPQQEIAETGNFSFRVIDLSRLEKADRDTALRLQKAEEVHGKFDLRRGPLIRGCLFRLQRDDHVLLITMHHIVSDGWSLGVFIREFADLYKAYRDDRPDPLMPLPIQYADYVQWQRQWLQGEVLDTQLSYWRRNLRGAAPQLELPTDSLRPLAQSHRGSYVDVVLDPMLTSRLRALAERRGVTLSMVLYAGWAILLSRLSGQTDVLIGTPVANRQAPELEGLIGLFVNTLVLRIGVRGDLQLAEFLQQVREVALGAYDHQDVPFDKVVEAVQPERSLTRNPIFQVMLAFQNTPGADLRLPGVAANLQEVLEETAKFDLLLSLEDRGNSIVGNLNFGTDLFRQYTIERWVRGLQVLLEAMTENEETCRIDELPILSERERHLLVESFNSTQETTPLHRLVHELFEEQVDRTPGAVAVLCDRQSLTYGELNRKANQLARYLRRRDVGPERRVGICVDRGFDMVIGVLGILKAGGAYVPLDPNYPDERVSYMIEDCAPTVLLSQGRLKERWRNANVEVIALDADRQEIESEDTANLSAKAVGLHPHHLAYVIYTSGSTGRPKGVAIEHCNTVNLICWARAAALPGTFEQTLYSTSLNFDLSVYECFVPLSTGGSIRVVENALGLAKSPPGVTLINTVPSAIKGILDMGGVPATVRDVNLAGEVLEKDLVARIFASTQVQRICNLYGPSETTTYSSWVTMPREGGFVGSIGRPIANTQFYILDRRRQIQPIGAVGEIYIGGAGVARCYLNRPELTAERFIPNPFGKTGNPRLYRSGDLGRWLADGTLEYLGRNDQQIKIRGYRIELGEIEATLGRHPQVKEAAVLAREDVPGESRLVAYAVAVERSRAESSLRTEGLRTWLKSALPEYMVPSAFVVLDRMPLTPSGKIDRRALPAPELRAYVIEQYEAPQGEVENVLAGIWQALLRVEKIGRHDNFFKLGGHSLLIVQMMERLRRVGLSVEIRRLFENPRLADLAGILTDDGVGQCEVPPNLIPPDCETITPEMLPLVELESEQISRIARSVPGGAPNIQDVYPLAPLQEGILFHHLLKKSGGDAYVMATLLSVSSPSRLEELIAALQYVVDRHDILRTAVLWDQLPQPVQVVYRRATLQVETIVLQCDRDIAEQIREWLRPERQRLDLGAAPLMRLQVAADPLGSAIYALVQLHHIVCDHLTAEVLVSEAVSHLEGRAQTLSEPFPYRNHVVQALTHARIHDAEAFFRKKLARVNEPTAPFGLMDVHGDGSSIDEASYECERSLSQRLRAQARRLGVSSATLFHAAWSLVVARTSGRDVVVFGTVLLGRLQGSAGAQTILGLFTNTLPVMLRLQNVTVSELVEQIQRELIALLGHEQASLALAQRCSGIPSSAPLFSALLNYRHSMPDPGKEWAGATGIRVLVSQDRTNYPITLSVDDSSEGFTLTAQTDRRVDPQRIIGYMSTAIQSIVDALAVAPEALALTLQILPVSERRQVLESFNATGVAYQLGKLVHELFEVQAELTPEAPAVVSQGQSLSYRELNMRANQLAHYLTDEGVAPDQLVGLCVERGIDMIVGLLGILKAGGAYVPLDPAYPAERIRYVLHDAAPIVLLTQQRLRDRFRDAPAKVITLDGDWSEIAKRQTGNLDPRALGLSSNDLAYVIYTSGTTGEPKGVAIEHRNTVNLIDWARDAVARREVFELTLQSTSLNFDLSVYECFVPLTVGGCIRIVENALDLVKDPGEVTLINTVPSAIRGLLESGGIPESTRAVNLAGEVLTRELVGRIFARSKVERVCNLYGPSETTTYSSWISMRREGGFVASIGRPIANTQIYILDSLRQAVPVGVMGEIYIGGAGVARGYLNRPGLTSERFIADPFTGKLSSRLYKTGDFGRWRTDGTIEYLGRHDHQVKIRGHRVELGEIEEQLKRHAQVTDAVVLAREDVPGERRLVAYVVGDRNTAREPLADDVPEKLRSEMVSGWESLWRETYGGGNDPAGPSFVGWNSSYTGQPIPGIQMREWLACAVDRIRALRPTRVLEIGCGVGLVLQHLAPHCRVYLGTDLSAAALAHLRHWMDERGDLGHVELLHRSANDLRDLKSGSFDTVVMNSVVQYFPDVEYLVAVLQEVTWLLGTGGKIFLGDVRHAGLLPMFHSSVQLSKAGATVSVGRLRKRIARSIAQEKELVVDPQFFYALPGRVPGISGVDVQLKRGWAPNELTRYRYDVVLHIGDGLKANPVCKALEWETAGGSAEEFQAALESRRWAAVRLISIPNSRLSQDTAAVKLIETADENTEVLVLRRQLDQLQNKSMDPEKLWQLSSPGYDIQMNWGEQGALGYFEAQIIDRTRSDLVMGERLPPAAPAKPWSAYANDPLDGSFRQQLIPKLREYLKGQVPEYMMPSAWIALKQLPLTPSGKVDRRALPAPQSRPEELGEYVAPVEELEHTLANIWAQLLRVDQVGVQDNFFDLGGHSLLAIRALSRINQRVGSTLSVNDIYRNPTIRSLVNRIRGDGTVDDLVDLSKEAVLDARIVGRHGVSTAPPRSVLLTGCTGFVGRFLLSELLTSTDATVYCLVRGQSVQQVLTRLRASLIEWRLWREEFADRIAPVVGDLGLKQLGIDDATYQLLCDDIDSVFHCGTSMNHLETYSMAKPVNVLGTSELLKIATMGRPKVVNYISTLGVFTPPGRGDFRTVNERSPIDHEKHRTSSGYLASKWVSEKMVLMARERGVPCNVFRLGFVWADTRQGRYDSLQWGYRMFKSCLLSGHGVKNYRYEMPPTPVDYVARAVVSLANRHSRGDGIFHISSTTQMNEGVFERCNEIAGTALELVSFYEWVREIRRLHHAGASLPAVPLIEETFSMDEDALSEHQNAFSSERIRFDCARTHAELEPAGIVAPALNDALLRVYLENMFSSDPDLRSLNSKEGSRNLNS